MNEEGSGLWTFLSLRDNGNDFSVVNGLSMVTSGKIKPLPLSIKYSKDVNIQNSQFISHSISRSPTCTRVFFNWIETLYMTEFLFTSIVSVLQMLKDQEQRELLGN